MVSNVWDGIGGALLLELTDCSISGFVVRTSPFFPLDQVLSFGLGNMLLIVQLIWQRSGSGIAASVFRDFDPQHNDTEPLAPECF